MIQSNRKKGACRVVRRVSIASRVRPLEILINRNEANEWHHIQARAYSANIASHVIIQKMTTPDAPYLQKNK
jgi:hypothetical protein